MNLVRRVLPSAAAAWMLASAAAATAFAGEVEIDLAIEERVVEIAGAPREALTVTLRAGGRHDRAARRRRKVRR